MRIFGLVDEQSTMQNFDASHAKFRADSDGVDSVVINLDLT